MIVPSRRGFLAGLGAVIAAPAIVRASSLMRIKPTILTLEDYEREILAPIIARFKESNHWADAMRYSMLQDMKFVKGTQW